MTRTTPSSTRRSRASLFAFNKGEVCTCPSRALVHELIFDKFMEKAVARVAKIKVGDPLGPTTQMGAQCSEGQLKKILNYIDIGKKEGAKCMTGGGRANLGGALKDGFYVKPIRPERHVATRSRNDDKLQSRWPEPSCAARCCQAM